MVTKMAAGRPEGLHRGRPQTRKALTEAVATAKQDLVSEVRRIFGGDSPELLERLRAASRQVRRRPRREGADQHRASCSQGGQAVRPERPDLADREARG